MHINKINDVHFYPNEPSPADTSELQTDIDFIKTTLSNRVIPDAPLIPEKGRGMNLSIYYQRLKYYSNLTTHENDETPENA